MTSVNDGGSGGEMPFLCCGCGTPLDMGEYRSCECPTNVGVKRETHDQIVKRNRCAWCDSIPTHANIDGDDLCHACCNKWARGEGLFAQQSATGSELGK